MANARLIRDTFKEESEFSTGYDAVCEAFLVRYKKLAQQVRKILDEASDTTTNDISIQKLAEHLRELRRSVTTLGGFYEDKMIEQLCNETLTQLVEHFEKIREKCELMLAARQRLGAQNFKQLEIALRASDSYILRDLCEMKLKIKIFITTL